MILLIIGSEQSVGCISKDTSTLAAMVVNGDRRISKYLYQEYIDNNRPCLSLCDDDDWIIIVLEVTRQVPPIL